MRASTLIASALLFVVSLGACFSPDLGEGQLQCGLPARSCPDGLTCNPADNHCYTTLPNNMPAIFYLFDGDAKNSGRTPNDPATTNGTSYVEGKFGSALHFGSTSAIAQILNNTTILGGGTAHTIAFWFRNNSTTDLPKLFSNADTSSSGGISVYYQSGPKLWECAFNSTNDTCQSQPAPPQSTWHSMVIEQNVNTIVYYLDGNPVFTFNGTSAVFNASMASVITLGGDGSSLDIDDLKIYNTVYDPATRCKMVVGGTWSGSDCILP